MTDQHETLYLDPRSVYDAALVGRPRAVQVRLLPADDGREVPRLDGRLAEVDDLAQESRAVDFEDRVLVPRGGEVLVRADDGLRPGGGAPPRDVRDVRGQVVDGEPRDGLRRGVRVRVADVIRPEAVPLHADQGPLLTARQKKGPDHERIAAMRSLRGVEMSTQASPS